MKKDLFAGIKGCKKMCMVCVYVLLVALLSLGVVGCSEEESVSAKTTEESVADFSDKKTTKKVSTTKTDEVLTATDTHGKDETEESKEEVKETTKASAAESSSKTTTSSSAKKSSTTTSEKSSSSSASTTTKKETSSSSSSSSSSSNSKTETTTKKEETTTHTHSWEPVYKEVDNGSWTKELVKEAWTEEVPQYTMITRVFCNGCNADITDCITEHTRSQMLAGNYACGGYTSRQVKTQIGVKTVEHPAEYKDVWVSNMVKEVDYYKCSCGATK